MESPARMPGGRHPPRGAQALELYLAVLSPGWLPEGLYHHDRSGRHLAQLAKTPRADLEPIIPSLQLIQGGAVVWIIVGDGARVKSKYGERGLRFLLLEAGHLMQSCPAWYPRA